MWENALHGENLTFLILYHLKDFNLLFLKLVKFCLYDTYMTS